MAPHIATLLLIAANLLIPVAILTFASGFFPYKPFISGLAEYENLNYELPPAAPFDKLIFMVVDALRSDFVYSVNSGFTFTQSLIAQGAAIPFTAHATSPTITMPRIKAITTGSIPSFLDVILNFAESDTTSTLANQDTWLAQMKKKAAGKTVMYGDDTWLKLFPETFDRSDGTSSFFVSDFTEVDNNVTRHIPEELNNDDWSTMIFHYLGLDHIGHKSGPHSQNMVPKQREMDSVIRQVYEAIESKDYLKSTLLVLCGDHGMNDAGNHGGSAPGETSPALVFISPKFKSIATHIQVPAEFREDFQYYKVVEQSDIAPTLGGLLGFPVPVNNLGAFIPEFLPLWQDKKDKVQILLRNAHQVLKIVIATFPSAFLNEDAPSPDCFHSSSDVEELACKWRAINRNLDDIYLMDSGDDAWSMKVIQWLHKAQELMSSTASNYDMSRLILGIVISSISLILTAAATGSVATGSIKALLPFISIALAYGIMMFASSYVEEEQHFWYWTTTAWIAMLGIKYNRKSAYSSFLPICTIGILVATRISRRWNQTGQKFAGDPDIGHTFLFEHKHLLWTLVGMTYLWNLQSLSLHGIGQLSNMISGFISTYLVTVAVTFKLAFANEDTPELMIGITRSLAENIKMVPLVLWARSIFSGIAIAAIFVLISGLKGGKSKFAVMCSLHDLLTLFLITQSRLTNIPLLSIFGLQFYLLAELNLDSVDVTITSLLLQYMSFFVFGGSNAISSVDLSNAYNGVSGFNVLAVGILTFVSNWAGPIYWTSATNLMLLRLKRRGEKDVLKKHLALLTAFATCSILFVMAACTLLRAHLFIWTVFSPKYLYSMAWSLGQHLVVNLCIGGLLYWAGI
ncbi:GPI ethanolamine phosphate transferase-like protein 2 [Xylogone sp. PMI_703]|nr:GPI ethanolamine phosphate transferase-like protein 2 [Xylogone sp. PMI_703]